MLAHDAGNVRVAADLMAPHNETRRSDVIREL